MNFKRMMICCSILMLMAGKILAQKAVTLNVGDKAPPIKVFSWIKREPIKEFKKGRIYVVEFGATWCKPCAAAIPHLTKLAASWKDKVDVLGIFVMEDNKEPLNVTKPKYVSLVDSYVARKGAEMDYHVAVDGPKGEMENTWLKAAGKIGVPVTFVIDRDGKIAWIGTGTSGLEETLKRVDAKEYSIADAVLEDKKKADNTIPYDPAKLLLINGNGGADSSFLYRSVLTRYDSRARGSEMIHVGGNEGPDPEYWGRVQSMSSSIAALYMLAYGDTTWTYVNLRDAKGVFPPKDATGYEKNWFEPILEVSDPTPFDWSYRSEKNRYNYSLQIPPATSTAKKLQAFMRRDLMNYFGYEVVIEQRKMPYWKLVSTDSAARLLKAKDPKVGFRRTVNLDHTISFENASVRDVIQYLGTFYGHGMTDHKLIPKDQIAPYIDETGIDRPFDMLIDQKIFKDFKEYVKWMNSMGLNLVRGEKMMKVVVIRDPKPL